MIGSVFSPYYAWSGRQNPQNYIGFNVGLYGKGVKRWTLTERGQSALTQSPHHLAMGPSSASWDGHKLVLEFNEWSNPIFRKVMGKIEFYPDAITQKAFELDGKARHFWQPIAPSGHVKVTLDKPDLSWEGDGYLDSNWGSEPLEDGFTHWDWSRAPLKDGAGIYYDAFTRDGVNRQRALKIDKNGTIEERPLPPRQKLENGPIWRVPRTTLGHDTAKTLSMLEDTPFYTRSHIETKFDGETTHAVHESLDLDKFASHWVKMLLPFRMPRKTF